jgi:hypothetical protein
MVPVDFCTHDGFTYQELQRHRRNNCRSFINVSVPHVCFSRVIVTGIGSRASLYESRSRGFGFACPALSGLTDSRCRMPAGAPDEAVTRVLGFPRLRRVRNPSFQRSRGDMQILISKPRARLPSFRHLVCKLDKCRNWIKRDPSCFYDYTQYERLMHLVILFSNKSRPRMWYAITTYYYARTFLCDSSLYQI